MEFIGGILWHWKKFTIIFHNYDKQTYQVVACMGNEPSKQDIKDFENQYGITLPADFREFTMSPLGGLYMEVREEIVASETV